jgi:hypothetical protein
MIQVTAYDPVQDIVTLDILGQVTQATPPSGLYTQSDWMSWLASVIQPVVDSMIKGAAYDPMKLVQLGDLSAVSGILTSAETAAITQLFPGK